MKKYVPFSVVVGVCIIGVSIYSALFQERELKRTPQLISPLVKEKTSVSNTKPMNNQKSDEVFSAKEPTPTPDASLSNRESKLAEYPGFGHNSEQDEETFSEEELAREHFVADCMAQRGFEYTPSPSIVVDDATAQDPEAFERLLQEAASDPNEKYLQGLSHTEQEAYYLALVGMKDPNAQEAIEHEAASFSDSCVNQAFSIIPSVYEKRNALREEIDQMELAILQDDRLSLANDQWTRCMSDAQLYYSSPQALLAAADQEMAQLLSQNASVEAITASRQIHTAAYEMSHRCYQQADIAEITREVRIEYENRFVDAYQKQLDH
ncbi:hypothetical protein LU351_10620 [Marinibactrum halimedae]|nr:hypothetical protein [Marinibactrum halimedae]